MRSRSLALVVILVTVVVSVLTACGATPAPVVETVVVEKEVEKAVVETVIVEKEVVVTEEVEKEVVVEVTSTPPPAGPVELEFWMFGSADQPREGLDGQTYEEWHQELIDAFEQEHPNIKVNFRMAGQEYGGTTLYIDAALAAGEPPDILWDWAARLNKYAALGGLEDLSDVIEANKDDFVPGMVALTTDVDRNLTWGVPVVAVPVHLVINKSAFEEAGCLDKIPDPDGDREWTTDQYMEALRCVNDPPNMYGTIFFAKTTSGDYCNQGYLFGYGATYFDPLGTCVETVINNPEGVAAMEFIQSVIDEGLAVPGPAGLSDDDLWAYYQRKQVAVTGFYPYAKDLAKTAVEEGSAEAPYDVYFANFPHAPGQPNTPIILMAPETLVVFKQKDPARLEAAKTLLTWLTSGPEYVTGVSIAQGEPLTSLKSVGSPLAGDPDIDWLLSAMERNGATHPGYNCAKYSETRSLWIEAAQAAWSGDKTAQEALDDYVEQTNALLAEP